MSFRIVRKQPASPAQAHPSGEQRSDPAQEPSALAQAPADVSEGPARPRQVAPDDRNTFRVSARRLATPLQLTSRMFDVLRLVGVVGPAPFDLLERLAPALVSDLSGKRSLRRLLYRDLERLERARLVRTRRLPLARAGVYAVTPAGAGLLRAHDAADVPEDALERFMAFPDHEAGLRLVRAELLLARFAPSSPIQSLAFDDRARFPVDGGRAYEPDGYCELTFEGGDRRVVFIELDRATKPGATWEAKMQKAAPVISAHGPEARLLVLAPAPGRLANLLQAAAGTFGAAGQLRGCVLGEFTAARVLQPGFMGAGAQRAPDLFNT